MDEKQNFADKLRMNDDKVNEFLKQNSKNRGQMISEFIDLLNDELGNSKLNKLEIINATEIPYMSSAIFKSLIKLTYNLEMGRNMKNPTFIVLNYAKFINKPVKILPAELKEDKVKGMLRLGFKATGKKMGCKYSEGNGL